MKRKKLKKSKSPQTRQPLASRELVAGIYRHYKGDLYQFIGVGQHSETDELLAIYFSGDFSRGGPRIRCRPLQMFTEEVLVPGRGRTPRQRRANRKWVPRFEYLGRSIDDFPEDREIIPEL